MNENAAQLDAEELLHFAIRASQNKQHEKAILYLKHALTQEPDNAKLHYFLGAQHAEIGLYDRAVEEMSRAVTLDPALDTAHFQLGLLHATAARIPEAEQAWQPLDKLGEQHPLYLFKTGLLQLTRDEFEDAAASLRKGMELNQQNPNLNQDMARVLNNIEQILEQQPANDSQTDVPKTSDDETQQKQKESTGGNHIFLSAYNKDNEDDDTKH